MSKSLVKAIEVLDSFLEKPVMSINELTEITGMPKTTVFRLANSLEEAGLLVKEKRSSHDVTYRMSLKFLKYGKHVSDQLEYSKIALPHMRRLNRELDELVHLSIREDDHVVYVETVNSSKPIRIVVKVGERSPLYAGSGPKLILASMKDEEIRKYLERVKLEKLTPNTLDTKEKLLEEIAEIRRKGYAISFSEHFDATVGISFPIHNYEGEVVAALGVTVPEVYYTLDLKDAIIAKLKIAAEHVSKELGYTGNQLVFP